MPGPYAMALFTFIAQPLFAIVANRVPAHGEGLTCENAACSA